VFRLLQHRHVGQRLRDHVRHVTTPGGDHRAEAFVVLGRVEEDGYPRLEPAEMK
jgi:hypothetical protein